MSRSEFIERLTWKRPSKFSEDVLAFICDERTIQKMANRSLKEWAEIVNQIFPHLKISASSLRTIYLANGIKHWVVYFWRQEELRKQEELKIERKTFLIDLATQFMLDNKVVFVDEAIFGNFRLKGRVWAKKNTQITCPIYGS